MKPPTTSAPPGPPPGSRRARRLLGKRVDQLLARIDAHRAAMRHSGAGYPVDLQLREFLDAYNDRRIGHGPDARLPYSHALTGGFYAAVPGEYPYLGLRPERDHAFLLGDFLDFATAPGAADAAVAALAALPEGVVHNYSPLGDVRGLAFLDGDGDRVVLGGASLVRHGDLLTWMTVGGPIRDLAAETEALRADLADAADRTSVAPGLTPPDWSKARAEPLPGTADVWKHVTCGVFNLATRSHDGRSILKDRGVLYDVVTDDPGSFGAADRALTEGDLAYLERVGAELARKAVYVEIAETAFALPLYFAHRIDLVLPEPRRTALGTPGAVAGRDAGRALGAPPEARPGFRTVRTLRVTAPASVAAATRRYTPPRFRVELEGFWRPLGEGRIGKDRLGHPVEGVTWVKGHARWRDRPARQGGPILVKASVAAARERAEALVLDEGAEPVPPRPGPG